MNVEDIRKTFRLKNDPARLRLLVTGRVQGVGFRPAVYRLANRAGLGGWVRNTRFGVVIEIEGGIEAIRAFVESLATDLPPLARIDGLEAWESDPVGEREFRIAPSEDPGSPETAFPVDVATCPDCLSEMRDSANKRHRYPFINCTNCGPRFTIIEGLPYDRSLTTMREFTMDRFCRAQYQDPSDRRFHAEPISCPDCGPELTLVDAGGDRLAGDAVGGAEELLAQGLIVAVKGLGGYHLACRADDDGVVKRLRERKRRPAKPFACMFRDIVAVERCCVADEEERRLLLSPEAPIVLLRRGGGGLSAEVAPRNGYVGAFLPYAPVHHLLMERFEALIMTSANVTDEPLISTEDELGRVLGPIADAALIHNRRIAHKCDDSIFFVPGGAVVPIRRARGFVPEPMYVRAFGSMPAGNAPVRVPMVALGAQEKSTFALSKDERVFVSPHLGDLGELRSQENFRGELLAFEKMLDIQPKACVRDMHPDYFTSRLAAGLGLETILDVQHHHAHAASVMAEHGLPGPALAVTFDGTGFGTDGKLWGGEFLLARYDGFERLAALTYVPLPGGEAAIREPWRMALSYLWNRFGDRVLDMEMPPVFSLDGLPAREILDVARRGLNSPLTSSMGRLFDAVAFMLGCGARVSYEAEAAVALEALALGARVERRSYSFAWKSGGFIEIDSAPVIEAILDDLRKRRERSEIAAAFHRGVAKLVLDLLAELSRLHGCTDCVISGGVFQNRLLCECVMEGAASSPLRLHQHSLVPPNDGGISLGQLAVGVSRIARRRE